jgi:nitroreductase
MKYNLSEITDLIRNRRTISPEQFSKRQIHKEQVELLLNNAIWAPTHGKTQPWNFNVFMGEGKKKLSDFLLDDYVNNTHFDLQLESKKNRLKERPLLASVALVVSMQRQETEKIEEIEEIEAVAAAIQNLLLTATACGFASFWSTPKVIYSQNMNQFLSLQPKDKCLGIIYLGYPENEWPKGQRKPIEYCTKWITQ